MGNQGLGELMKKNRAVRSAVLKQQLIVTYSYGAFEMCESE